jgi:hypothetical protein
MSSTGENALAALFAALPTPAGGKKFRNRAASEDVPVGGLLILRDGDRGEPIEEQINPPSAVYRHAASIEIFAVGSDDAARTAKIDALALAVRAALAADRTLGGAVDWAELRRGSPRDDTETGASPVRIEDATAILEYQEEI